MIERLFAGLIGIAVALVLIRAIHAARFSDYRSHRWWL